MGVAYGVGLENEDGGAFVMEFWGKVVAVEVVPFVLDT